MMKLSPFVFWSLTPPKIPLPPFFSKSKSTSHCGLLCFASLGEIKQSSSKSWGRLSGGCGKSFGHLRKGNPRTKQFKHSRDHGSRLKIAIYFRNLTTIPCLFPPKCMNTRGRQSQLPNHTQTKKQRAGGGERSGNPGNKRKEALKWSKAARTYSFLRLPKMEIEEKNFPKW